MAGNELHAISEEHRVLPQRGRVTLMDERVYLYPRTGQRSRNPESLDSKANYQGCRCVSLLVQSFLAYRGAVIQVAISGCFTADYLTESGD